MCYGRDFSRALILVLVALLAGGCSGLRVVDERLSEDPTYLGPETGVEHLQSVFSSDDVRVTLSVLFDRNPGARGRPFMAEWLFPDGTVYLRVPVRTESGSRALLVTSMHIRGEPPSRRPGIWRVRLSLEATELLEREFEIRAAPASHLAAGATYAGAATCHQLGWTSGGAAVRSAATGTWLGAEVLSTTGATYTGMILLSRAAADCATPTDSGG
jgi:hypothetical protein